MPYSNQQLDQLLSEVRGDKVLLTCPRHNYVAKLPPDSTHCPDCWKAYYIYDYAKTPPHMRAQRLSELDEVVRKAAELEQKGQWDFEPASPGSDTTIIEDGFDDESGEYRKSRGGILLTDE